VRLGNYADQDPDFRTHVHTPCVVFASPGPRREAGYCRYFSVLFFLSFAFLCGAGPITQPPGQRLGPQNYPQSSSKLCLCLRCLAEVTLCCLCLYRTRPPVKSSLSKLSDFTYRQPLGDATRLQKCRSSDNIQGRWQRSHPFGPFPLLPLFTPVTDQTPCCTNHTKREESPVSIFCPPL
jgi:hypothetical protein